MSFQFIILLSVVMLSFPAWAIESEDPCSSYPNVTVQVTPLFDEETYDYTKSIAAIQAMASDIHHSIHESLTLGLTRYEPLLQVSVPIKGVQLSNGLVCAHVDQVDVKVGYRNVTILIAQEIPKGTCGFDIIMGHELKHVKVNQQILDEYVPIIENRLKDYLRDNGVIREQNLDYALKMLHEKLQDIVNELVGQMSKENMERQQKIDSIEEYRRITNSCHGELAQLSIRYLNNKH